MKRALLAAVLAVALVARPTVAAAVPPRSTGTPAATSGWQAHFEAGRESFERGAFEDAAESFFRARESGGPPSVLYNQALSLDRLGRYDAALAVYRHFLEAQPDAPNRDEVVARIAALESAHTETEQSGSLMTLVPLSGGFESVVVGEGRPVARIATPRLVVEGPTWVASWFFLAGALGAAGTSLGFWIDASSKFDAGTRCTDCALDGPTGDTLATVFLVSSAVLGVTTVLSFIIEGVSSGGPRMQASITPGGLVLEGSF